MAEHPRDQNQGNEYYTEAQMFVRGFTVRFVLQHVIAETQRNAHLDKSIVNTRRNDTTAIVICKLRETRLRAHATYNAIID